MAIALTDRTCFMPFPCEFEQLVQEIENAFFLQMKMQRMKAAHVMTWSPRRSNTSCAASGLSFSKDSSRMLKTSIDVWITCESRANHVRVNKKFRLLLTGLSLCRYRYVLFLKFVAMHVSTKQHKPQVPCVHHSLMSSKNYSSTGVLWYRTRFWPEISGGVTKECWSRYGRFSRSYACSYVSAVLLHLVGLNAISWHLLDHWSPVAGQRLGVVAQNVLNPIFPCW